VDYFFSDGVFLGNKPAGVANEPDAVFFTAEAARTGRVTFVPSSDGRDLVEIIGTPDLVVEVVSPSSVTKDYDTLRVRYHAAGIPEYWVIDAQEEDDRVVFEILRHTPGGYEPVVARDGWLASGVLSREFRLDRSQDPVIFWRYLLHVRPLGAV
jgi:Uma2 family endonuclease